LQFYYISIAVCNAKYGDLGANADSGSKYVVVESAICGIADPNLPIHSATFMGLWWRWVVYSWALPLLWKKGPFWAKIWRFWGIN